MMARTAHRCTRGSSGILPRPSAATCARSTAASLAGAAVYGDQPLTDGMLARNLGGISIQPRHAHEPDKGEPWWPRVMRQAGRRALERRFQVATPRSSEMSDLP